MASPCIIIASASDSESDVCTLGYQHDDYDSDDSCLCSMLTLSDIDQMEHEHSGISKCMEKLSVLDQWPVCKVHGDTLCSRPDGTCHFDDPVDLCEQCGDVCASPDMSAQHECADYEPQPKKQKVSNQ